MTIKQKKSQSVGYGLVLLFATLAMAAFAVFDVASLPHKETALLDNVVLYYGFRVLCLVCAVICAWGVIFYIKQLCSDPVLIEVCDEYLYDHSSALSVGKIMWEDIAQAYVLGGILVIRFVDAGKYQSRLNKVQRAMGKLNQKMNYGDTCIVTTRFAERAKEFLAEVEKRHPFDPIN